ncbi:unnamed protein product, partial [Iphiclides podalirius]
MEIRIRHYSIVINCVILIPCLLAKPFSLNEAIAEEVRGKQSLDTSSQSAGILTQQEPTSPVIIPKVQSSKAGVNSVPDNKIPSLQYKRTFKIRTPIKPKRLKRQQKLFYRNKNKTAKGAIESDEIFNSKYIPLLKSLTLLFDHILNTDTSESYELATNENEKHDRISENNEAQCSCTFTPNTNAEKLESQETTTTPLTTFTVKIPDIETDITTKATTSPAHNTASVGETIMDSVREAAPQITEALKDISPGIMEIMNVMPDTQKMRPFHNIMKNIPIALHETMQVAMNPLEEYPENIPEIQTLEEPFKIKSMRQKKIPAKKLDETYLKDKINLRLEDTKQKAQYLYQTLIQDYDDIQSKVRPIKQNQLLPTKIMKKATTISHSIAPVINDSLAEMAHIPQKIKKFVEQMKQ